MKYKVTATYRTNGRLIESKPCENMAEVDKYLEEYFERFNKYLVDIGYEICNFSGAK